MKLLIKSCDTYNKDLTLATNNSLCRGLFNICIFLLFIGFNAFYIIRNLLQPQVDQIYDLNYIDKKFIDYNNLKINISIKISEKYTNESLCDPYISVKDKIINFDEFYYEQKDKNIITRYSTQNFSIQLSDFYNDENWLYNKVIPQIYVNKGCSGFDGYNQRIVSITTQQNTTLNKLNYDYMNSSKKLFNYDESTTYIHFHSDKHLKNYSYYVNTQYELNVLYDDFKNLFDTSTYSSFFVNNYANDRYLFIKSASHIFSSVLTTTIENNKMFNNNSIILYTFYVRNNVKFYIRIYKHFLFYLPMFVSICSIAMRGFNIFDNIIRYKNKYFYFMNNNCRISWFEDLNNPEKSDDHSFQENKNLLYNSDNSVTKKNTDRYFKQPLLTSKRNSINDHNESNAERMDKDKKDIKEINKQNDFNNISSINSISINKECKSKLSNISRNSIRSDGFVNNIKISSQSHLRNNCFKYTIKDAFLLCLPFNFLRSKKTQIKYKILKDVKIKLNETDPSFSTISNNTTHYLIYFNLLEKYGKDFLFKPIYNYNLNDYYNDNNDKENNNKDI